MVKQKIIYKYNNPKFNPLKVIEKRNLKGWEIGSFTILCKNPDKKLRNILCEGKNIKGIVFGQKQKKLKSLL